MPSPKEIKNQVTSIKKIQKITDAMQKVSASKMYRTHKKMASSTPYAIKIREVVNHVVNSATEYRHPYLEKHKHTTNRVGYIVISTDSGLCGSLNTNLFKIVLEHAQQLKQKGIEADWCLFGEKAASFFRNITMNVLAYVTHLGESPQINDLIGSIKIMLDAYKDKQLDQLYIAHNEFISTMVQKPVVTLLLPLPKTDSYIKYHWDYIYEPSPKLLLNTLMMRYIETQIYQAVIDNIACEQVARMLAMRNATNNAKELIDDLQLIYNKVRQATITKEISEIIGGTEAI